MNPSKPDSLLPEGYATFLNDLKTRIRSAQVKAALSVNREMIVLYWEIGKALVDRLEQAQWGDAVLEHISRDLRQAFPELKGFSRRNLYRMQRLFRTYRAESEFVPQLVAQIPWGHNIILIEKVKDPAQRQWYIEQTIANGWSRNVLVHQIETDLYTRQVDAPKTTNFAQTLPPLQSDLAQQVLKDPYIFGFLSLTEAAHERDLERSLLDRLKAFLLELGAGFAFMGSQYHLVVGGEDFYIDLLFCRYRLTHTLPGALAQALPAPGDLEQILKDEPERGEDMQL